MVHLLRNPAAAAPAGWVRLVGRTAVAMAVCLLAAGPLVAQQPPVHFQHHGIMPPGAIGSRQLLRGGPLPGFFQPVQIRAPNGVLISLATEGRFDTPQSAPLRCGMLIGQVYRIRVMSIPRKAGLELYPTVEIINRLYTPAGHTQQFPIPVELTQEDLELALAGKYVTRVIYLEDPLEALPVAQVNDSQHWFDVGPGQDPLAVADGLGRPMAILRMGVRLPESTKHPSLSFLFGCPPVVKYAPEVKILPPPPKPGAAGRGGS
jgi:hypothetical protein